MRDSGYNCMSLFRVKRLDIMVFIQTITEFERGTSIVDLNKKITEALVMGATHWCVSRDGNSLEFTKGVVVDDDTREIVGIV